MTSVEWCGIIEKLTAERQRKSFLKKSKKTLKKPIDKSERMWYNRRVALRETEAMAEIDH